MTNPISPITDIATRFIDLHGDRAAADSNQIQTGLGWIGDQRCALVIWNQPEIDAGGYRQTSRIAALAAHLCCPLVLWTDHLDRQESRPLESLERQKLLASLLKLPTPLLVVGSPQTHPIIDGQIAPERTASPQDLKLAIESLLAELSSVPPEQIIRDRRARVLPAASASS